ncbi:transcriptional regulator, LysR family [Poseidonocella pacifica]|uniref:Transcriptional regulator, LysR family n=1 Tax=Poseidonocella pacifica TaxID=871651 RepID=A0A1I0WA86_9RHOB|nr:LysR family transcriptional regulator [Poseidonocella pacifica]SFA85504.1 transcriptional regulator, LysR family [Poseidonocella pacifica]
MPRNIDLTALRSFVAVADAGGVTRAAGMLNLTQSAVSMQLKRLEENLGLQLLDRSQRQIAPTASGEKLLSYARRMLDLNDEAYARLTDDAFEGEVVLGVPYDIVYPAIPRVLQQFHADFPRMTVQLISSFTRELKEGFEKGTIDLVLTTEDEGGPGSEMLVELPLLWIGAPGGIAWRQRPLRLGFCRSCIFRGGAIQALDAAGIAWEIAVESEADRTIEATVSADLAITAQLEGTESSHVERIQHGGALPELAKKRINLYSRGAEHDEVSEHLANLLRSAYRQGRAAATIAAA